MLFLSLLLLFSLSYAKVEKVIEGEVYKRFGDSVRVQRVRLGGKLDSEKVDKIELQMEYGRSRAVAYVYSGEQRYQAIIEALWKVKVYIAIEDIPKDSPINLDSFRVEERFVKTIPSDLRIEPQEFENFVASTKIAKGTMLRRSLLKEVPAVSPGDVVEAVYRSGSLEIVFKAVAVDGGKVGKIIRLKKDDKVLRGKIISKGVVEVLQ